MGKKAEALHKSLTGQGLASRATGSSLVHKVASRQVKTREAPVRGPEYEASQQKGQACRQKLPRSDLGKWEVRPGRSEAVDLIFQQDADRLSFLVPERHRRMAASPFAFFRGAALPMAADLSTLPTTGLLVQACGDAHIANFGGYRSPESHLVFDLNDFDETARGHWEWDVERLVASVAICGRTRGFGDKWCREAVRLAAQSYRESLAFFATQGSFDVWRAYLDVAEVLQGLADKVSKADRRQVADDLERAFSKTNERAFEKLVHMEDGEPQMVYDPPDIVPLSHFLSLDNQRRVRRSLVRMLDDYRATVRPPYQELLKNYRFIGAAQKVVGVGQRGHPLLGSGVLGQSDGRPAGAPDKGGERIGARAVLRPKPLPFPWRARRGGAAPHADNQRSAARLDPCPGRAWPPARLLRASVVELEDVSRLGPCQRR